MCRLALGNWGHDDAGRLSQLPLIQVHANANRGQTAVNIQVQAATQMYIPCWLCLCTSGLHRGLSRRCQYPHTPALAAVTDLSCKTSDRWISVKVHSLDLSQAGHGIQSSGHMSFELSAKHLCPAAECEVTYMLDSML